MYNIEIWTNPNPFNLCTLSYNLSSSHFLVWQILDKNTNTHTHIKYSEIKSINLDFVGKVSLRASEFLSEKKNEEWLKVLWNKIIRKICVTI